MTHDETQIGHALRRLRDGIQVPPLDPTREQALLAVFDTHRARPRGNSGRWAWTIASAASIVIALALDWLVVRNVQPPAAVVPDPVVDLAGFVPWPGANAWPPFESGSLMRVELPVSALPSLGLWPPQSAASVVEADIVVGQDGYARAVRLVQ